MNEPMVPERTVEWSFSARKASQCDRCSEPIEVGDIVLGSASSGYGYCHVECSGTDKRFPGIEKHGRRRQLTPA